MNFDFNNVKEVRQFVGYGINHDVTIIGVKSGAAQSGTPFVEIDVKLTGDEDKNFTMLKLYITDKSTPIAMRKIMAIHSAVGKIEALKSKNFDNVESMAAGLDSLWKTKRLRLKLQASEYAGVDADGNPKTKTRVDIPLNNFVEAIDKGAEMYPITNDKTQLVFNDKDPKDYKRLNTSEAPPKFNMGGSTTDAEDDMNQDLPF